MSEAIKKIYIAGPYTKGDVAVNVAEAIKAGNAVAELGYAPFVPHLCHFLHMHQPRHYEVWMNWCFTFVECCDALVRLPGESSGADREVDLARELGLPVYAGLWDFEHGVETLVGDVRFWKGQFGWTCSDCLAQYKAYKEDVIRETRSEHRCERGAKE